MEEVIGRVFVERNHSGAVPIGSMPERYFVPRMMHAWVLIPGQHGNPSTAFCQRLVPVPRPKYGEVLIFVMAAGVNYNGVWAARGEPVSVFDMHGAASHIAGSDASGIVWAVGEGVTRWKVGDEVVVHCNQIGYEDIESNGGDPMLSPSQKIWGYETPGGSFAQFTVVQAQQLLPRPKQCSWVASAAYLLKLATVYRMLYGHPPHVLRSGVSVLIWGAAGGLGVFAVQLCRLAGAKAIAVVSDEKKVQYVQALGASTVIVRTRFPSLFTNASHGSTDWMQEAKAFGGEIWAATGKGNNVDIVLEHPGQQTFPLSCFLAKRGGLVVFCAATTGYRFEFDARYVWMQQKRIQGSHFAHMKQAHEANSLVMDGHVDPCVSRVFNWEDLPLAHELMARNEHPPGNMVVKVGC
ncbi:crotonyl-CoA carboxylase/reductase [Paraburkholderia denitrificans]|uniref:Crotonyl-CoA carboxylase/reductase n=1 Tax=Paraburkholderia denitrificans TaxID=694025 RepID=A0ABW0J6Y2_9BURK